MSVEEMALESLLIHLCVQDKKKNCYLILNETNLIYFDAHLYPDQKKHSQISQKVTDLKNCLLDCSLNIKSLLSVLSSLLDYPHCLCQSVCWST